jgi:predicted transcriptional regulator
MSDKEVVLDALKRMREAASLEEISEEIAILAAIRRGEAAAQQGRVVSHAEVKERSASWTTSCAYPSGERRGRSS